MAGANGVRDASSVRVLLLASGVNSLTQRVMVDLSDAGYDIRVSAVSNQAEMQAAFDRTQPDVVVAPYLKKAIPECSMVGSPLPGRPPRSEGRPRPVVSRLGHPRWRKVLGSDRAPGERRFRRRRRLWPTTTSWSGP